MKIKKIYFYHYCNSVNDSGLNRINLIAEGMREHQVHTEVNIMGVDSKKLPDKPFNNYLGKFSFFTLFSTMRLFVRSVISIIKKNKIEPLVIFIVPTNSIYFGFVTTVFSILKIKIVTEKLEEFEPPNFVTGLTKFTSFFSSFITKYFFYLFDMTFAITDQLLKDMRIYNKNPKKIPPVIVDYKYFSKFEKSNYLEKFKYNYICYAGHLVEYQNGALSLLEGFAKACEFNQNLFLVFINVKKDKNYNFFLQKSKKLGIENKVIFTNYLRKKNLKKIYYYSTLLVVLKPFNKRNIRNFPGKLAEYLATGSPTLISNTGDSVKYLKDNISSFIVKDLHSDTIGQKIDFILNNKILSDKVGKIGQSIAINFDKSKVAEVMLNHLNNFKKER